jgi:hypothetical protein
MILGDASISNGVCKKGNISTPNKKLNQLIKENFKTYYIDEFRTSKLHYKTEEPCDNLYNMDNNKDKTKRKERKIHSVLTFKMEKKQSGCINRDENAVNNMLKIVNHHHPSGFISQCDMKSNKFDIVVLNFIQHFIFFIKNETSLEVMKKDL